MDQQKGKEEGFRVVDRRISVDDSEVEPQQEVESKEESPEKTKGSEQPAASGHDDSRANAWHGTAVDFSSFIVSLATQAMMMMGEIPDPESKMVAMNLAAARQTIDIIVMLEEKTRGNLSDEEQRLLRDVLSSLQLAFVDKINRGQP